MILAIDIGNTNIVVGGIDREKIYFIERISTNRTKTALEYAIDFSTIISLNHYKPGDFEGSILSSVVPQITNAVRGALERVLGKTPLVVGPGLKTGLNIALDNPSEMGADRVADAVGAKHEYHLPVLIIDMGTATTLSVVDAQKRFIGGIIMPGVMISLDALTSKAAKLSGISIDEPENLIGRNTVDCMKSGIVYGTASCIDGLISRIREQIGEDLTVVATGGLSGRIVPHCREKIILDENLLLKGMMVLYYKNA